MFSLLALILCNIQLILCNIQIIQIVDHGQAALLFSMMLTGNVKAHRWSFSTPSTVVAAHVQILVLIDLLHVKTKDSFTS
jgi:hypothetical protein